MPQEFPAARLIQVPALREQGTMVKEDHPAIGSIYEVGHPIRFGRTAQLHSNPAPRRGEHSAAILRELGRTDDQITDYLKAQVTAVPAESAS